MTTVFAETRSPYEFELVFPDKRIRFRAHASTLRKKVTLIIEQTQSLPLRLEPDDIVTQTEIAKRIDASRVTVRKHLIYSDEFPLPVPSKGRTIRWRWWDVAHWLIANGYTLETKVMPKNITDVIGMFNTAFALRSIICSKR